MYFRVRHAAVGVRSNAEQQACRGGVFYYMVNNGGGGISRVFQMIYLDTINKQVIVLEEIIIKDLIDKLREWCPDDWKEYILVVRY